MKLFRILMCLLLLVPTLVRADSYPAYQNIFLNDYAGVIPPEAQDRIKARLQQLKDRSGVEMTVITIPSRKDFAATGSIETFALGLFNYWGVGGKERNDGILVLVATADREMRVQLGAAYNQGYDVIAQDIIDRRIEPQFRAGRYADGIEAGMAEIIDRIASREPQAAPPPVSATSPEPASGGGSVVPWLFGAGMAVMIAMAAFGARLRDMVAGFKPCPQCGRRGLHIHRETVTAATATTTGIQNVTTSCPNCGWRNDHAVSLPVATRGPGDGGSFGGGKSSGGGATGRW